MPNRDTIHPTETELAASLRRLDIVELERRLEFSPLLAPEGAGTAGRDVARCLCKIPDDLPDGWGDVKLENPLGDGMGSTGTTSGEPLE